MQNIIDQILSPFQGFDIGWTYSNYGQIIDGIIFFCLFLGISQHTFGRLYKGRPGKVISIALSLMLTIALLLSEQYLNFSIKSFGVVAVGVVLVFTGFFVFSIARSTGMNHINSFCLAYVLIFFSVAAMVPNLFDFIATRAPILNGITALVLLFALIRLPYVAIKFAASRTTHKQVPTEFKFNQPTPDMTPDINEESKEIKVLDDIKRNLTSTQGIKDSLDAIHSEIKNNPVLTSEQATKIKRYLYDISNKEKVLNRNLFNLERTFKQLGRIDTERLRRLESELEKAPANLKKFKDAEIDVEKSKIEYDRKILEIKRKLDTLISQFNQSLQQAINTIQSDQQKTLQSLNTAKSTIQLITKLTDAARRLEKEVIDLHKRQRELMKGENRRRSKK
jgi:hypothetical protein